MRQPLDEMEGSRARVYIVDNSSNGTFINGNKLGKGNRLQLYDGDEISLVAQKGSASAEKLGAQGFVHYLYKEATPSAELTGVHRKYDIREILGTGHFSVVKVGVHRETGERWAVKVIEKKKFMLSSNPARKVRAVVARRAERASDSFFFVCASLLNCDRTR